MSAGLKNVCLTAALPGASRNSATSAASTTTVLAVDSDQPPAAAVAQQPGPPGPTGLGQPLQPPTQGLMVGTLV